MVSIKLLSFKRMHSLLWGIGGCLGDWAGESVDFGHSPSRELSLSMNGEEEQGEGETMGAFGKLPLEMCSNLLQFIPRKSHFVRNMCFAFAQQQITT
jgi:hypothetical protein